MKSIINDVSEDIINFLCYFIVLKHKCVNKNSNPVPCGCSICDTEKYGKNSTKSKGLDLGIHFFMLLYYSGSGMLF